MAKSWSTQAAFIDPDLSDFVGGLMTARVIESRERAANNMGIAREMMKMATHRSTACCS